MIRSNGLFIKTTPGYLHAKSSCYVYELAEEGIDTGITIEGEGGLFLGATAIREMAGVMGWSLNEEGAELERSNAYLEHELAETRRQLAERDEELTAIGTLISRATKAEL